MKKTKKLILGAGISGLSFAYFSKKDYLILEKDDSYGGYCRTFRVDDYIWDYAGHFYHFKTKAMKKTFESLVEKEEIIEQEKNTKIYYKGTLVNFPFQMNIHELPKEEFIDCLYDLFNKEELKEKDFLDMLYNKFGKSITEKFLKPYNEKLYAVDLRKLDKDAMGRFFPYADKEAIIRNMKKEEKVGYNADFMYLKKGTQYFIDKLYNELDTQKVLLNEKVEKINTVEKYVETANGNKYYYENLINTMPLNKFLSMLNGHEKLTNEMSFNQVLVLNLGFAKSSKNFQKEHWIYFPDKNLNFYRVGFYNNILNEEKLSLYVEIGYDKDTKDIDVEAELEKTLQGLRDVGILDNDNTLEAYNHVIMNPAYVHINSETNDKIQKVVSELDKNNIFTLGRYGKWTYNSMEDSMVWAQELASQLRSKK